MSKVNKEQLIIDALGQLGALGAAELSQRTGLTGAEIRDTVREMMGEGQIVQAGNKTVKLSQSAQDDWDEANKPKAKPASPKAKQEVVEPDISREEIDAFIEEYNDLYYNEKRTKAEEARFQELYEFLDSIGEFDSGEESAQEAEEVEEEDDPFGEEPEEVDGPSDEELQEMKAEYMKLASRTLKNKSQQAREAELYALLVEAGEINEDDLEPEEPAKPSKPSKATAGAKEPTVLELVNVLIGALMEYRDKITKK